MEQLMRFQNSTNPINNDNRPSLLWAIVWVLSVAVVCGLIFFCSRLYRNCKSNQPTQNPEHASDAQLNLAFIDSNNYQSTGFAPGNFASLPNADAEAQRFLATNYVLPSATGTIATTNAYSQQLLTQFNKLSSKAKKPGSEGSSPVERILAPKTSFLSNNQSQKRRKSY